MPCPASPASPHPTARLPLHLPGRAWPHCPAETCLTRVTVEEDGNCEKAGQPLKNFTQITFLPFHRRGLQAVPWQKMDTGLAPESSDLSARGGPTRPFSLNYGIYSALEGLYTEPGRPRRGRIQSLLDGHQFGAGAAPGHTRPSLAQSPTCWRSFTRQSTFCYSALYTV